MRLNVAPRQRLRLGIKKAYLLGKPLHVLYLFAQYTGLTGSKYDGDVYAIEFSWRKDNGRF